jgi:transposase-like protein
MCTGGGRVMTLISDTVGEVNVAVPRDREGSFEPVIVKKRQRRLGSVDEIVLYAKGLTTGEISAYFSDIDDASVSKEAISRITESVVDQMQEWQSRPLDECYAAVFIDGRGTARAAVEEVPSVLRWPVLE